jgi:hypothetical protein
MLLALLTVQVLVLASSAEAANPNDPEYWEGQFPDAIACYKHDGSQLITQHGWITDDGKSVTLRTFREAWPGDHYEVLVVKSGSVDNGWGPGNAVYVHPNALVAYFGPLNASGEQGEVSHWIVCKGEDEVVTTTTTTTTIPEEPTTTTTTTIPEEPTTTTTTTIPEEPTTTTIPEEPTTTTIPEEPTTTITTTTLQAPTSTSATTTTTVASTSTAATSTTLQVLSSGVESLPDTGAEIEDVAMAGLMLILFGLAVVAWARVARIASARRD